ncbi:MAG: hypothetical protein HGA93_00445 [Methanothrix sp.]|nr:hypothetical protein [Methanothrix sp.]
MAKLGQAFAAIFFGIIFLTVLPSNFIFPEFAELAASIHLLITLFVVGAIARSWPQQQYCFVLASFRTWIYFKEMKGRDDTSVAPVRPNISIDKYLA